jgi:hypothetical protein
VFCRHLFNWFWKTYTSAEEEVPVDFEEFKM